MIGQRHGGFLGFAEKVLDMTNDHIWFERGETRDRQMVVDRLTQHCTTGWYSLGGESVVVIVILGFAFVIFRGFSKIQVHNP